MESKLQAINLMLASIAQLPVNTTESKNLYAIAALDVLERTNRETQECGWWFNTDPGVVFTPTNDGEIRLPDNCLRILDVNERMNAVIRDGKLYDPIRKTHFFGKPLVLDVISLLDFEDIPYTAKQYIARLATEQFFTNRDGEQNKLVQLRANTAKAMARLSSEGIRQFGVSYADSPHYRMFMGRMNRAIGAGTKKYNRMNRWA